MWCSIPLIKWEFSCEAPRLGVPGCAGVGTARGAWLCQEGTAWGTRPRPPVRGEELLQPQSLPWDELHSQGLAPWLHCALCRAVFAWGSEVLAWAAWKDSGYLGAPSLETHSARLDGAQVSLLPAGAELGDI